MNLVHALEKVFLHHKDSEIAGQQKAYLKHQFAFLGIKKPVRALLEKEVFKQFPLASEQDLTDMLRMLWAQEAREFQYAACELAYKYKKLWTPSILTAFEYMIREKSWWDTVDDVAVNLVGLLVQKYPELTDRMDAWIHDEHLWIRRTALLHQLRWKHATNQTRLFDYCFITMHEKDFFIRKAIGWVLREYSKTNPQAVRLFIEQHDACLSGLSIREASRYL